jgi:outer membrane protein assembly factor BamB
MSLAQRFVRGGCGYARAALLAIASVFALADCARAESLFSVTASNSRINELNPNSGALLNSFAPPVAPQSGGGNGLAFSGSLLYYTTIETSTIYALNPGTGAVVSSFTRPAGPIDSLGYGTSRFGATLFTLDYTANRLDLVNPGTGAGFSSYQLGFDAIGGIDFNSVTGTLYISDQGGVIRQINPDTGAILGSFSTGGFQGGVGLVGGRLFTGSSNGLIYERDPSTGVVIRSFTSPGGYASALAGSPVPEPSMWGLLSAAATTGLGCLWRRRRP